MKKNNLKQIKQNKCINLVLCHVEINKMYPTYSLPNEIKIFINSINEGNGIKDIVDEYNELNTNIINSINCSDNFLSKNKKSQK